MSNAGQQKKSYLVDVLEALAKVERHFVSTWSQDGTDHKLLQAAIARLQAEEKYISPAANAAHHQYAYPDPVPDGARLAHSVSVIRCECGHVCIRFHKPATTTDSGKVFAAAFLDRKRAADIGEDILKTIELGQKMPCHGRHH